MVFLTLYYHILYSKPNPTRLNPKPYIVIIYPIVLGLDLGVFRLGVEAARFGLGFKWSFWGLEFRLPGSVVIGDVHRCSVDGRPRMTAVAAKSAAKKNQC